MDTAERYEVLIESLAFGGDGVGRLPSGKVVFVPYTVPTERVLVSLTRQKSSYAFAQLEEILEPSAQRIAPRCPVAGRCGGCDWQHIGITDQRRWKRRLLTAELQRVGAVKKGEALVQRMVTGEGFGHRTRARMHRRAADFGTMESGSQRVITFESCPILAPSLHDFVQDFSARIAQEAPANVSVEIYVDADGRRGLEIDHRPPPGIDWIAIARDLDVHALRLKHGQSCLSDPMLEATLMESSARRHMRFEPGVFVQTNREINARLVRQVLRFAGEGERFAEVYAGAGNFSMHLTHRFRHGSLAEGNERAVACLRRNIEGSPARVMVHAESDDRSARRLSVEPPVDLIVLDPPRVGMQPMYRLFEHSPPARLVLVSCHPMAAVRDIGWLVREHGYRLDSLVPVDLFPQTAHLELIAHLVR